MLDIFSGLRLVVKRRSISIDNAIFRCHWFFTSTLLVSFSLVITARQYVGQPIECHSVNKIPDSLLNSYCWVQSTFSVPQACNQQVGFEVPYPCIDNTRGREVKLFAYYQWVGMVLFIQGLLFHLPYYLWKVWENGLIRAITGGLRVAVLSDQERIKKRDIVIEYIHEHLGCHKRYALKYFLCESICLINLLGQLWATNNFFDGQFLRYGIDVMQYSSLSLSSQFGDSHYQDKPATSRQNETFASISLSSSPAAKSATSSLKSSSAAGSLNQLSNKPTFRVDPMTYIFPRMTKCTYYDFGSSGDVQKHDALCLLPLNIINEKIYIALWFWFLVLGILTLLVIFYRLLAWLSESVRCKGLISRCKLSSENDIRIICKYCDVGDWFLFYMVAENLDPLIMREIVASIASKIRQHLDIKSQLMSEASANQPASPHRSSFKKLRYRAPSLANPSSFELESPILVNRRSSLVEQEQEQHQQRQANSSSSATKQLPVVKKLKKRLYSKRLWSVDLGSGELRQQLFGGASWPPEASDDSEASTLPLSPHQATTSAGQVQVSAPPISQMPLNSIPPNLTSDRRRLSRTCSSGSALLPAPTNTTTSNRASSCSSSSSFVMEMQGIDSESQLGGLPRGGA